MFSIVVMYESVRQCVCVFVSVAVNKHGAKCDQQDPIRNLLTGTVLVQTQHEG